MNADTARALLDVEPNCTAEELRAAFKARSRMMHPDRFSGRPESEVRLATRDYQRLERAYQLLREPFGSAADPPKSPRRGADVARSQTISGSTAVFGGVIAVQGGRGMVKMRVAPGTTPNMKLRLRGHGGAGTAGGAYGDLIVTLVVGSEAPTAGKRGRDLTCSPRISAHQAEFGALLSVEGGRGRVMVRIAPGAAHGATVRVAGHGEPGTGGGENGDLIIALRVEAPPASASRASGASADAMRNHRPLFPVLDNIIILLAIGMFVITVVLVVGVNS